MMRARWWSDAPGAARTGLVAVAAVCLALGALVGWFGRGLRQDAAAPQHFTEFRDPGTRYTSPLLDCDIARGALGNSLLRPFSRQVEDRISRALEERLAGQVSVYFRDLNNGPWFSISPEPRFVPASLTKVPILIAFLKRSEAEPGFLDRQVAYTPASLDLNSIQTIRPERRMNPGARYRVWELLERLIVDSDNNVLPLLVPLIGGDEVERTLSAMGIGFTRHLRESGFISVEDYAAFFRILYNASYLNRENSERALKLLAATSYTSGLRAGVPPGIAVAHKFGEYFLPEEPRPRQLHDCGIVYVPQRPYLLCVMTRGDRFEELSEVIADVSRTVYASVTAQPPLTPAGPAD